MLPSLHFHYSNVPIDFNLYKKFWALQDYFRNPTQCYNNAAWKAFTDVSSYICMYRIHM